jgi:predicted neuraminidase
MLLRSTRGAIYRSDSTDSGRHWGEAYPTKLPNNNSGLDLARFGDVLVLACNPVHGNWGRRTPLAVLTSADNGESWSEPLLVEPGEGEFSYPAIVAAADSLHLAYTIDRRAIGFARFVIAP